MESRTRLLSMCMPLLLLAFGCAQQEPFQQESDEGRITIAATFFPLYDLTRNIAGDYATAFSVVPQGAEPHDYEPKPSDILRLSEAGGFVTLGLGLEFERIEETLIEGAGNGIVIIDAGIGVPLINSEEDDHTEEDAGELVQSEVHEEETAAQEHRHTGLDPHIWLSPRNMIIMAGTVSEGLQKLDPEHAQEYKANAEAYIARLEALDEAFSSGLSDCAKDTILVNHMAFTYLADAYGFSQIAVGGLSPEIEPTPKQIQELIREAREHDIAYVFYEEFVDPKVAYAIAAEVGAKALELNPAEGTKDADAGYLSLMEKNLANLRLALECS
ncbi:TPA: zinc ABC transporter solute-binding protein [Candidatus Woesearchaeota archaeon]|nr:zinc ABC transporter solute-binding protein [Candidatus Woesearchaeota archaeon]HII68746.1 zinc ABC transporter solute-binding protein [Candidatus Woesearchaeota archaeon]